MSNINYGGYGINLIIQENLNYLQLSVLTENREGIIYIL